MDFANWKKLSSSFGHSRSAALKRVDDAVATYAFGKSLQSLKRLAACIIDWQATKGDWLVDSVRSAPMKQLVQGVKTESVRLWPAVGKFIFNRLHCDIELRKLRENPANWLGANPLAIGGGAADGILDFYLTVDHPDPTYGMDDLTQCVSFFHMPRLYKLNCAPAYGAPLQNAMNIVMHRDFTAAGTATDVTAKLAAVPNGPKALVTGALSGCSFLIRTAGAALECTHIEPNGQTGSALQNQLTGFNIANTRIFGRNDYPAAGQVTIIGINIAGWEIFAQLKAAPQGPIVELRKIYP